MVRPRCLLRLLLLVWAWPEGRAADAAAEVAAPAPAAAAEPGPREEDEAGWWSFRDYRFQRGDDPRWAEPGWDDSAWPIVEPFSLPSRDGIYWVRWRVNRTGGERVRWRDGLLFKMVASYDLYWDGRLMGRNGRVGATAAEEMPGVVDALFQIPREWLGPGEHVVALRISSFHTGFPAPTYGLTFVWGNFRTLLVDRSRTAVFSLLAVGAALVVAIVFGLIWLLAGRRRALLWFSLLFLCTAASQALQAWRWLYEYPYPWHYPRLVAITSLVTAIAVLLPAFVMEHFELRGKRWVLGGLAAALALVWQSSPMYNRITLEAFALGFSAALVLAFVAAWRRRRGAALRWPAWRGARWPSGWPRATSWIMRFSSAWGRRRSACWWRWCCSCATSGAKPGRRC
jgi:hypothetical protein